jgi:hypothetical protein
MAGDSKVLLAIVVLFLLLSGLSLAKTVGFARQSITSSKHKISAVPIPTAQPVHDDGEIKSPEKDVFANGDFQAGQGIGSGFNVSSCR